MSYLWIFGAAALCIVINNMFIEAKYRAFALNNPHNNPVINDSTKAQAKYCPGCGYNLTESPYDTYKYCPYCATSISEPSKCCPKCGANFNMTITDFPFGQR
jgi:hypothetical protein